jgi:hypothetical protein
MPLNSLISIIFYTTELKKDAMGSRFWRPENLYNRSVDNWADFNRMLSLR